VFIVVSVYFVIDSVRKLLNTFSYALVFLPPHIARGIITDTRSKRNMPSGWLKIKFDETPYCCSALTHDPPQRGSGRGGLRDRTPLRSNDRTRTPHSLLQTERRVTVQQMWSQDPFSATHEISRLKTLIILVAT
jgi:hypothetical protein